LLHKSPRRGDEQFYISVFGIKNIAGSLQRFDAVYLAGTGPCQKAMRERFYKPRDFIWTSSDRISNLHSGYCTRSSSYLAFYDLTIDLLLASAQSPNFMKYSCLAQHKTYKPKTRGIQCWGGVDPDALVQQQVRVDAQLYHGNCHQTHVHEAALGDFDPACGTFTC